MFSYKLLVNFISVSLKLNKFGSGFPFSNTVSLFLNSSKNGWFSKYKGFVLLYGSYTNILSIKSKNSSGICYFSNTFPHGFCFITGNLYSVYSGFIACICCLLGVPNTFIISTICSRELSPAKSTLL